MHAAGMEGVTSFRGRAERAGLGAGWTLWEGLDGGTARAREGAMEGLAEAVPKGLAVIRRMAPSSLRAMTTQGRLG